jgi:hypothetical protein
MTPRGWIILALVLIAVVLVLWGLRHSPPSAMRTADEKQIERETAEIQRNFLHTANSDGSNPGYDFTLLDGGSRWKRAGVAIGLVAACMLVAAVVVPK